MSKATGKAATWYQCTFHGRTDQVSQVRRELARYLAAVRLPMTRS
jgi:hypothetical protein